MQVPIKNHYFANPFKNANLEVLVWLLVKLDNWRNTVLQIYLCDIIIVNSLNKFTWFISTCE